MPGPRPFAAVALATLTLLLAPGDDPGDAAADAAAEPVRLGGCGVIDQPGEYVVGEDVRNSAKPPSSDCLLVLADDVVIEGDTRALVGHGASDTTGIHVVGATNVTIRNLHLFGWHRSIHLENADGVTIENVTIGDSVYGLAIQGSTDVAVRGCRITDNFFGVWTAGAGVRSVDAADNEVAGNTLDFDDTAPTW
jgi:nitrous oxidase accessory protein NosD